MIDLKRLVLVAIGCVIFFGGMVFVPRLTKEPAASRWYLQPNGIRLNVSGQTFTLGQPPITGELGQFWQTPLALEQIELGKNRRFELGECGRISEHLWKIKADKTSVLIITEGITETELNAALTEPVSYQVDYWIVFAAADSVVTNYFPLPEQAVFLLSSRQPTKAWRIWSEQHQVPIFPVASFGDQGLSLVDQKILQP